MSECWTILVEKKDGENLRQWLIKNSLLKQEFKIQAEENKLIFPIIQELSASEKKIVTEIFQNIRFEKRMMELKDVGKPKDLFTAIKPVIPEDLHQYIPKSFDIIGKLVVIEIPEELQQYEKDIGEEILTLHPSLTSVFKKIESVQGEYRLRGVHFLTGINNTETIHKENKCIYEVDIKRVYFSPRLATEHDRVCSLVESGEKILDMFAGIGPFSILIAKQRQVQVYAVDVNPAAILYLKRNIILNKVENFVKVFEGDVREVFKKNQKEKFDRIIMNLPSKSSEFLDIATIVLRANGIIHYYQFVSESDYPTKFLNELEEDINKYGRNVKKILNTRKVRAYAPYIWQIGVDILVK